MKDMLISSTTSMSNDSFASESLTIEYVLSSNEISYSLKSLIDIKAADYSFINEVIVQIVYDQLQIELLTLIKTKSIREFNNYYAKKLITHVIYLNLTVQNHTIEIASMLITQLDQHQMILEKTWMNKINLSQMSNDTQSWVSLFLKRKLSENLKTESSISLFSEIEYHLTFWVDFLQTFRSYFFQSAVFMNIILNSTTSNCIFRKMLNIEILKSFASANQFKHQNHQFSSLELIYARWLFHILWKT